MNTEKPLLIMWVDQDDNYYRCSVCGDELLICTPPGEQCPFDDPDDLICCECADKASRSPAV